MELQEMLRIFDFENIQVDNINDRYIEEKHDNGENYYRLELLQNSWNFVFVQKEKMSKYDIQKEFKTRKDAIKYFCFYELRDMYSNKYLDKVIENNELIGTDGFEIDDLLNIFHTLLIDDKMYAFVNKKNKAVNLMKMSDDIYVVAYINENGTIIHKTIELDKNTAFYAMFRWTYLLSILNNHLIQMKSMGLLTEEVSDNEYKILFS